MPSGSIVCGILIAILLITLKRNGSLQLTASDSITINNNNTTSSGDESDDDGFSSREFGNESSSLLLLQSFGSEVIIVDQGDVDNF